MKIELKKANKISKQKMDKKRIKVFIFKTVEFKTLYKTQLIRKMRNYQKTLKEIENNILLLKKRLNIIISNNEKKRN